MFTAPNFHPSPSQGDTRPVRRGMKNARGKRPLGFTLVEVLVAGTVLVLTAVSVTQAMLQLNRRAALSRVTNAAKAEALSRIQQVTQCSYNPNANPAVIPDLLDITKVTNTATTTMVISGQTKTTTTTGVDIGSTQTNLGHVYANVIWVVKELSPDTHIRSVKCTVNYAYLGKNLSYELFTYKSPE